MKEWIAQAWGIHDREPERLALELEARVGEVEDADDLARFLRLSNHTIGSHLHDWPRARQLAQRATAACSGAGLSSAALAQLAIAQHLDGAADAALATEARSLALSDEDPIFQLVAARLQLAQALIADQRLAEGGALYDSTLELAERRGAGVAAVREVAIASNNIASQLLEFELAEAATRELLERSALAAQRHWASAGTWVNEERALYLLALVYNALGRPALAREHAARALDMIRANGDEPVDETFLHLALAHSGHLEGQLAEYAQQLKHADALAAGFEDASLKDWYAAERAKVDAAVRGQRALV